MARTSRRSASSATPAQRIYRAKGYARLSVEDSGKPDADTIEMQKRLICEFIGSQPDMEFCGVCSDNGRTGTNFERPAFEELMNEVRTGKIDCIVVKDLSRFGRNYLETGNYLERVFPFLGVRFIAVNDNFDTLTAERNEDGFIVPLKNIINDSYSKDISRKIIPALLEKRQRGEFIGAWPAYGYRKRADDSRRIEPDEETAPVVREIFQWRLEGLSCARIVRRLNDLGIPSPSRYHYLKGDTACERYANAKWTVQVLTKLLADEVYIGNMVHGRKRSGLAEGQKQRFLPKNEWMVVRNTHEPLIDAETFAAVQRIAEDRNRAYSERLGCHDKLGKTPNILRGLVFCPDCKRPLVRYKNVTNKGKNLYYVFICPTHSADPASCPKKYIHETKLMDILWDALQREIALAGCTDKLVRQYCRSNASVNLERALEQEEQEARQTLERAEMLSDKLFQCYHDKIITEMEYVELKQKYSSDKEQAKARLEEVEQRREAYRKQTTQNLWLTEFNRYHGKTALTDEMAHALIERIEIDSENHVSVVMRYRNEYSALAELLDSAGKAATA